MDFEQARFNMVEQQIRPWDVLDPIVLDLLFTVRREEFVPAAHRALAFADLEIPLGDGEAMWAPKLEARVLQELQLRPGESVLEIGTGSGYFAALLASLAGRVTSLEIRERLARDAHPLVVRHGVHRAHVVQPVGQLDEDDAHVARHRQQHLAERLGLAFLARVALQLV